MFRRTRLAALTAGALVCLAAPAGAATITFDFEELATTTSASCPNGGAASIVTTRGGLTATISRTGGLVGINSLTGQPGIPAGWGARQLCPVPFGGGGPGDFLIDFSAPVTSVTLSAGDFEPSDDDVATLSAYSGAGGTGSLVASNSSPQPNEANPNFIVVTVAGSAASIRSARFGGGSSAFPQSMFWDNFVVTTGTAPPPSGATCDGRTATITGSGLVEGTAGDDVIVGSAGPDTILAHGGNDIVCAKGGDDTVRGEAGDDTVRAEAGNDLVSGGAGRDLVSGAAGLDDLQGGNDADQLIGGNDDDKTSGGDGDDNISGGGGNDNETGGNGNDVVTGGDGDDRINGNFGDDVLRGDGGSDNVTGSDGFDTCSGETELSCEI